MNNPQHVAATFIRETLLTHAAIQSLVPLEGFAGQYKVFWEDIPDWVAMPYIVVSHIAGGEEDDTQVDAIDIFMKVVGLTGDIVTASQLQNAIHLLHAQYPVSTTYAQANPSGYEWVVAYGKTRLSVPVFDRKVVQNVPVLIVGGIYRLRLMRQIEE